MTSLGERFFAASSQVNDKLNKEYNQKVHEQRQDRIQYLKTVRDLLNRKIEKFINNPTEKQLPIQHTEKDFERIRWVHQCAFPGQYGEFYTVPDIDLWEEFEKEFKDNDCCINVSGTLDNDELFVTSSPPSDPHLFIKVVPKIVSKKPKEPQTIPIYYAIALWIKRKLGW